MAAPQRLHQAGSSRTAFEPHVCRDILTTHCEARRELITVFPSHVHTRFARRQPHQRASPFDKNGEEFEVHARIAIDGTEYGDLMELGGIEYRFGREDRSDHWRTGRSRNGGPRNPGHYLRRDSEGLPEDARGGRRRPRRRTRSTIRSAFLGSTAVHADDPANHDHMLHTWETFIDYGKLPNNKYMINWPFHANDFPDALACFDRATRGGCLPPRARSTR